MRLSKVQKCKDKSPFCLTVDDDMYNKSDFLSNLCSTFLRGNSIVYIKYYFKSMAKMLVKLS